MENEIKNLKSALWKMALVVAIFLIACAIQSTEKY